MRELVFKYGRSQGIPETQCKSFFQSIQHQALKHAMELTSEIQTAATRMWTCIDQLAGRELCGILNAALREDNADLMPHVAVITRAINELLVVRRTGLHPPDNNVVYRGGGLPAQHQAFFTKGKQYRVPMFLASSFQKKIAQQVFCRRAQQDGLPPVLWVIHLDAEWGCMHVNHVQKTQVAGEGEYLFVPYAVFTVQDTQWSDSPTWMQPHVVTLRAAVDNLLEPDSLPLAPWA